ncbi:MAG: peptidase M75, partial [Myxococcales bacterium]|nr:peptidase M75 [Myxococcales bacterium]
MSVRLSLSFAAALSVAATACGADGGDVDLGFDDADVVADFADQVAVATYVELDRRVGALAAAIADLSEVASVEHFAAAREAWLAAREPWEQGEGFLFGPVDTYGFDPALDSWPVNQADLDAVLASDDAFTPAYIAGLQETQKGYHTIEYLLFGADRSKTLADLTERELAYLAALGPEVADVTDQLAAAWTDGIQGAGPYRDVIATAGDGVNTSYPSRAAAAQQMLAGMIGICDEVANGKIADPYDAHDPTLVESQFSFNSLDDFTDNLISVRNVWRGGSDAAGTTGRGLRDWVDDRDAALAARVDDKLAAA